MKRCLAQRMPFFYGWVIVANTFGRQHLGAIRGVMQTVNNLATFGGPWLFGVMYEVSAENAVLFEVAVAFWLVTITMGALGCPLVRPTPQPVPAAPWSSVTLDPTPERVSNERR